MAERRYHITPAGGDYSEIFYFDDDHNVVEPEIATCGVIRECKMDGTLVMETWFRKDLKHEEGTNQ